MNKFAAAAGLALALISGAALAADLPTHKAPPVAAPSAYNWGGLYGGINVGYGFANGTTSTGSLGGTYSDGTNTSPLSASWSNSAMTPSGVVGGGQIGYNYQITPMFVAGIEADIQAADMGSTVKYATANLSGNGYTAINNAKNVDWFGTARARIGVVVQAIQTSSYTAPAALLMAMSTTLLASARPLRQSIRLLASAAPPPRATPRLAGRQAAASNGRLRPSQLGRQRLSISTQILAPPTRPFMRPMPLQDRAALAATINRQHSSMWCAPASTGTSTHSWASQLLLNTDSL